MRLANKKDIKVLSTLRILQQRNDWKDEHEDKYDLFNVTKIFLNKDLYIFVEEFDSDIIATCGLQIIDYLPLISFAKEKGLCELALSTDSDKAINIYKKMGFVFENLMMNLNIK